MGKPTAADRDAALVRAGFERRFQGRAALAECLAAAESTYTVDELEDELRGAIASGAEPGEVFPVLFHDDPKVGSIEQAARLYSNLFGFWDALAGLSEASPGRRAPLVPEGDEEALTAEVVEAVWRETAALRPAELEAEWDRFANAQPDLLLFLERQTAGLGEEGHDTATMLAFEVWRALRHRPGTVLRSPSIESLEAVAEAGAPSAPDDDPFTDYIAEALEITEAEGAGLDAEALAAIGRLLEITRAALAGS
jgi:hypothetical protein